jgi:hypothetical protein
MSWIQRAYHHGCDHSELLILADAVEEVVGNQEAQSLRHHAATGRHNNDPSKCMKLSNLISVVRVRIYSSRKQFGQ